MDFLKGVHLLLFFFYLMCFLELIRSNAEKSRVTTYVCIINRKKTMQTYNIFIKAEMVEVGPLW